MAPPGRVYSLRQTAGMTAPELPPEFDALLGGQAPETVLTLEELRNWLSQERRGRDASELLTAAQRHLLNNPLTLFFLYVRGQGWHALSQDRQVVTDSVIRTVGYNEQGIAINRRQHTTRAERQHHLETYAGQHPAMYAVLKDDAFKLFKWRPAASAASAAPAPPAAAAVEAQVVGEWTPKRLAERRDVLRESSHRWPMLLQAEAGMPRRTIQDWLNKHDKPVKGSSAAAAWPNYAAPSAKKKR